MSGVDEIWDGNGGKLDANKAPQRDLIVALHVKMDSVVIPQLANLNERLRKQEEGELTRGQKAAVKDMLQADADARANRRSLRMPGLALVVSVLALLTTIVYTASVVPWGSL